MDNLTIISSLLSGFVGAIITILSSKYMNITNERKANSIEIIKKSNENILTLGKLVNNEVTKKTEIENYYNEFLKNEGAISALANAYFSEKVKRRTQSFLVHCDAVYLIVELNLEKNGIDELKNEIDSLQKELYKLENKKDNESKELISREELNQILNKKENIESIKSQIFYKENEVELLNIKSIELRYRIRKIFESDVLSDVFKETKKIKELFVIEVERDYKLSTRIRNFLK